MKLGQIWLVDLILDPFLGFKRIRLAESDVELVEHVWSCQTAPSMPLTRTFQMTQCHSTFLASMMHGAFAPLWSQVTLYRSHPDASCIFFVPPLGCDFTLDHGAFTQCQTCTHYGYKRSILQANYTAQSEKGVIYQQGQEAAGATALSLDIPGSIWIIEYHLDHQYIIYYIICIFIYT